jgi:hypothetical protein
MSFVAVCAIVLLAGYAAYVAWLISIAICGIRKKRSEVLCIKVQSFLTEDMRDCDYDLFWETQMPALEFLRSAGPGGVLTEQMGYFHHGFAQNYPELCEGSDFSDWIEALQLSGAAVQEDGMITITERGRFILNSVEHKHHANMVR